MNIRTATLGRPKPPTHVATITLPNAEPFQIGYRTPTVSDMVAAERISDNILKGVHLLIALTVDPTSGQPVYTAADKDGLLAMEPVVFQALTEAMVPVLSPKKPDPLVNGTGAGPSSVE